MEPWVLFIFAAVIIWTISNIIAKVLVEKYFKNGYILAIIAGIIGLVASVLIFFLLGIETTSIFTTSLVLFAGVLYMGTLLVYFKTLVFEEVSRVVPLFSFTPLFVLVLAAIFLNEVLSFGEYVGVFLIVIGAFLITTRKIEKIKISKALWFMLFSTFLYAIVALIMKYVLTDINYWTMFFWLSIGAFIPTIFLWIKYYKKIIRK